MILAFGSYVLLWSINPDLVTFKSLTFDNVSPDALSLDHACEDPADCGVPDAAQQEQNARTASFAGGAYKSDLAAAQKNRTAKINFDHFGKVEYSSYGSRKLSDVKLIVVHNGGYNAKGIISAWHSGYAKEGKRGTAHYTIERDGDIYQFINDEAVIVHGNGANKSGIGIEMNITKSGGVSCNSLKNPTAAKVDEACELTDAQYASLNSLISDIIKRTGAKLDEDHIIGHCEAFGATHGDPKAFDWSRIGLDNQKKKDRVAKLKKDWAGKSKGGVPCGWYKPY
jgi:N-acetyl-anhydromuramyl-L-alanine amidase AmpD